MSRQLPLFGVKAREKRACFFSLHPKDKAKKFSAYAPKAMTHFAAKYGIPVIEEACDLASFDLVFFSLHCFRDFYLIAKMAQHKRPGQEWIAGGNACATPAGVGWIMDYVWVGDCRGSFARILAGEPVSTPANADRAYSTGVELEARKSMGFITRALDGLSLSANLTFIKSRVRFPPEFGPSLRDLGLAKLLLDHRAADGNSRWSRATAATM
jgi:hypothetical protein